MRNNGKGSRVPSMGRSGNRSTGAIDLVNAIRGVARQVSKDVDQVVLGTVRGVSDGGKQATVLIDGFRAGNIVVGWALATRPAVGQRVTMIGPAGGQEWYVVGVLSDTKMDEIDEEVDDLKAENTRMASRITALQNSLTALARRVSALENG